MASFKKAERKKVKLKVGLTGPSGSGKTYSALELATGIGPRVALIDTENDSASLYSDRFDFDTLEISAPYTIEKYISAMKLAESEGYDVVIVDSLSHAWAGEGGILDVKNKMDARGGNSYTNWGKLTPEQEKLVSTILGLKIHLIANLRSKQDYVLELNEKGKSTPRKVGMAPIQREGMEYEFTTVFDIGMDHSATASKDRTGLFSGQYFQIEKKTGKQLMDWLASGKEPAPLSPPAKEENKPIDPASHEEKLNAASEKTLALITEPQRRRLFAIAKKKEVPDEEVKKLLAQLGFASSKEVTWKKYDELVHALESYHPTDAAVSAWEDDITF